MGVLDRISRSLYRTEWFSRIRDYSVSPKASQPVQTAQIVEDANQAAYRGNVKTPDQLKKEAKITGLGSTLDVEA